MTYTSVSFEMDGRNGVKSMTIAGEWNARQDTLADWLAVLVGAVRVLHEDGRSPSGAAKEANPAATPGEQTEAITLPGEGPTRRIPDEREWTTLSSIPPWSLRPEPGE